MSRRSGIAAAALATLLAFAAPTAVTAAESCKSLAAALARAEKAAARSGDAKLFARFDALARRQAEALKGAERQVARGNCEGKALFGGKPHPLCAELMPTVVKMRSNLAALEGKRDRHAPGGGGAELVRLKARIDAAGCFGRSAKAAGSGAAGPTVEGAGREGPSTARALRDVTRPKGAASGLTTVAGGAYTASFASGAYRTLCVRACDGYYFPLSFATGPRGFGRDEAICRQNGADFSLYVHRNPGQDSIEAVSLREGTPYRSLPTALAYRKRFDPACTPIGGRPDNTLPRPRPAMADAVPLQPDADGAPPDEAAPPPSYSILTPAPADRSTARLIDVTAALRQRGVDVASEAVPDPAGDLRALPGADPAPFPLTDEPSAEAETGTVPAR
jgi:Protein of unknown function (DUF2865).